MTQRYKVIKEFAGGRKGDTLSYDEDFGMYVMDATEEKNHIFYVMGLNEEALNTLVEKGYLLEVADEDEEDCDEMCPCCEKLTKVEELVDKLMTTYHNDLEATMKKAEEHQIPECVLVEAKTVYYNLNKVLKAIKDTINE